jgi:hypothetical protein
MAAKDRRQIITLQIRIKASEGDSECTGTSPGIIHVIHMVSGILQQDFQYLYVGISINFDGTKHNIVCFNFDLLKRFSPLFIHIPKRKFRA